MKPRIPPILAGQLAVLAAATIGASAATTIVDTTPATGQADVKVQGGQTFTTPVLGSDDLLTTITVVGPGNHVATPPASTVFTLKVWEDQDQNHTTWDPGPLVATSGNSLQISDGYADNVFQFSGEQLSSNTVYVFSATAGGIDHTQFRTGWSQGYASGTPFSSGAIQDFGAGWDLSFKVDTIPEPAAPGLLALGGLAALIRRRR